MTLCSLISVAAASRLRPLNVSAPAPPRRRVLDLFSYGGAHYDRILLVRLNELRDVVDLHVLVEMGVPLSLNRRYVRRNAIKQRWNASQRCWQGWADRILHVELDGDKLLTGVKKPAKAQQVMRTTGFSTALETALQRIGENAWVLLSDIDEVPRASALSNALLSAEVRRELGRGRTYALAGRSYYYNAECVSQPGSLEDHWIAGPKLLSSESLRSTSWQNLRTYFVQQAVEKRDELILWDASWHFGFLMTAQEQLTKLCLNVAVENHKICAHPKALSLVASASASCRTFGTAASCRWSVRSAVLSFPRSSASTTLTLRGRAIRSTRRRTSVHTTTAAAATVSLRAPRSMTLSAPLVTGRLRGCHAARAAPGSADAVTSGCASRLVLQITTSRATAASAISGCACAIRRVSCSAMPSCSKCARCRAFRWCCSTSDPACRRARGG